jgi:hypothetical protein
MNEPQLRRADHVRAQLALLAADVGRLRAHLPEPIDSYAGFLCERAALRVELADILIQPSAADAYEHFVAEGLDEDVAVTAALDVVSAHADGLRKTLRLRR